jgi:hypothetical protein
MWTITISNDEGRTDCGTITATWTEEDGTVFTFSMRSLTDGKGDAEFMEQAVSARDEWLSKRVNESAIASTLSGKLNTTDAKAVSIGMAKVGRIE